MITEVLEVYRCEYCRKLYQLKGPAEKHEKACRYNPDNKRACFGCKYLDKVETTVTLDLPYSGNTEIKVDILFCPKINSYLYPPKVEHKGNAYQTDILENKPMPRKCDMFGSENYLYDDDFSAIFEKDE